MRNIYITVGLLSFLLFGLESCNNESVKNEKPKENSEILQTKLPEKDMPYLEIKESQLKSSDGLTDEQKMQILYSALKRSMKYIEQDSTTLMSHVLIKSGNEINISPLLFEYLEITVKQTNEGIKKALDFNYKGFKVNRSDLYIDWANTSTMSNELVKGEHWKEVKKIILERRKKE